MKHREIDALICWHTDRLYRSMKDLERLIDIADTARIAIRTVNGGDLDLSNSTGRMLARILGSVARQESERKGERQRTANIQRAEAGTWQTANRCFGYTLDGTPLEPEATAFRTDVDDVLSGKSIRKIAMEWNAAGLQTTLAGQQRTVNGKTTTNSGQWNSPRVRRLLVNQRYAGLKVHRGKVIGKADWTPLIDEDTHRGLVAYLSDPKRVKNTSFERKYIGSGVYICGKCGGRMKSVWPTGRKTFAYVCGVKADILRSGAAPDDFVSAVAVERNYNQATVARLWLEKTSTIAIHVFADRTQRTTGAAGQAGRRLRRRCDRSRPNAHGHQQVADQVGRCRFPAGRRGAQ